jgi:hypothetical protein
MRERALSILQQQWDPLSPSISKEGQARFDAELPWLDKWIAAAFDSLYLVPAVAVQQIKQGDLVSSTRFQRVCVMNQTSRGRPAKRP